MQNARAPETKRNNGNHTPPKPPHHLLIHRARTFSAIFPSIRAEQAPQRAPKTKNVAISCKRALKKTRERSYTASIDTRRATRPTKQTEKIHGPTLSRFFYELGRSRPLLSTIQAGAGPIAALKKGGLTFTQHLFGTLGCISNPKPMVIHHSRLFVPGTWSVCIRRAAQMSEQRNAQSQRLQSKWTQIDGPNRTVRP